MTSMKSAFSLAAVAFAVACAASASSAGAPLPAAISGFDGWRGVKLVRGPKCPECCSLQFPAEFGHANAEELELLQSIIQKGQFKNDLHCVMTIDQDALKQLVRLATKSQDEAAALAVVRANGGGGVDLGGGELAEVYPAEYLVPVLLGFRRIGTSLTPDLERRVAMQICYAAYDPSTSSDLDEKVVAAKLKKRGAVSLARAIDSKCEEVKKQFGETP